MKILVLPLLLISLVLCSTLVDIANANYAPAPSPDGSMCGSKCDDRCSSNWRKKLCMKLCMICCGKCNCVPSGPKADKAECPCYRDMKNPKGQPKCP